MRLKRRKLAEDEEHTAPTAAKKRKREREPEQKDKKKEKKARLPKNKRVKAKAQEEEAATTEEADEEEEIEEIEEAVEKKEARFIAFVGMFRPQAPPSPHNPPDLTNPTGNLPFTATKASLEKHFAAVKPAAVRLITQKDDPRKCKGFAFLEFEAFDRMQSCLLKFHHTMFNDGSGERKINIELT